MDSGSIPVDSSGFLWNPVESSGMDAFLQESVGHQKVQKYPNEIFKKNAMKEPEGLMNYPNEISMKW